MTLENLCPVNDNCPFYRNKFFYNEYEAKFYSENCIKDGGKCGLKRNYDISERLKRLQGGELNEKNNIWNYSRR